MATSTGTRVRIAVFHAGLPHELEQQVNAFLAGLPAMAVRAVRFQTAAAAATVDDEPPWEYAALIESEDQPQAVHSTT